MRRLGKTLPLDQVRKCIPRACGVFYKATVQLILLFGSKTWTFVTGEFEEFGRVSYKGRLAYGRQEANEASRQYVDVPKLGGCS